MILVMVVSILGFLFCSLILGISLYSYFTEKSDEKYTIAFFGFLDAVFVSLIVATLAEWNDPVKVTIVDKDGQTLIYNVPRHQFDSNSSSDCVRFYFGDDVVAHCNIKSYTLEELHE